MPRTMNREPYIEKRDDTQTFESTPAAIQTAWDAHRPYYEIVQARKLRAGEAEPYTVTLLALQRLVRRYGHTVGYFMVDGGRYRVGFGGWNRDPKWLILAGQN